MRPCHGHRGRAASQLGVSRDRLYRKLHNSATLPGTLSESYDFLTLTVFRMRLAFSPCRAFTAFRLRSLSAEVLSFLCLSGI